MTESTAATEVGPAGLAYRRRSARQIRAMDWEGTVDAVLPAFTFGPFRPPAD